MIQLHYSNRLEELIAPIGALVHEDQLRDPLEPVTIVVPGRAVEEYLKLRLSDREGVAANFRFPFLRGFLADLVQRASSSPSQPGCKVLDVGGLQIAVFEYLREAFAGAPEGDLDALQPYLDAARGDPRQRVLRMFQLSARVAWLIREYSTSRRPMLERWYRGLTLEDPRLLETERWQRRIYLSLFESDGTLRPEWISRTTSEPQRGGDWRLLPHAFDAIEDARLREIVPPRLHVFGIGYAGPEFIRIFARLGRVTDLHLYTLNPCREFWEDVRNRGGSRPPIAGPLFIDTAEDPFKLEADDNLALRYWGRPGREYIRLLNELTECDFDAHFVEPVCARARPTLLARVQQAILTRTPEQQAGSEIDSATATTSEDSTRREASAEIDDGSIRFLQCPGVRRELQIAADAIWSMMRRVTASGDTTAVAPLRLHQIAIVLPEGVRDRYLAQIESVFAGAHRLPINIVDRRFASESRVAEAVDLLLKLPLGRFTRGEMIRLLTHPAIVGSEGEPYAEAWAEWCRRLGVHFGADEHAFDGTYVEPKLYHWDYALKRLALGIFMTGEPATEARVYRDAAGREYLPFETVADESEGVAIMVRKARALIGDAQALTAGELDFAAWRTVLTRLVATYVNPPDRDGARVRDAIVGAIESMYPDGIRGEAVPYEIVFELAQTRIVEVQSEHGIYAENGIVVGSLSALRSIPFRVTFMLGLGEADFPARAQRDPLDLRQAHRRAGDVSPAERDRYMFLETLLAARDCIFLSYIARDAQTGEALEPSAVIRDLQFILRGMIGSEALDRLTIAHPVSAHDRRYFADLARPEDERDQRLETFDRNARHDAQMAVLREDRESRCEPVPEELSGNDVIDRLGEVARARIAPHLRIITPPPIIAIHDDSRVRLSLAALRHYLECPLQGAARHALGMSEDDEGDEVDADEEPISRSRLDKAIVLRDALWRAHGKHENLADCYDEICRTRVLEGSSPIGPFAQADRNSDLSHLENAIAQAKDLGIPNLDGWQRIALGGTDEFAEVESSLDPIVLEVDFVRADGRRVTAIEVGGRVGPVSPRMDRSFKLIARKDVKVADFLDGGFGAVALAAAGAKMPTEFMATVLGSEIKKKPNHTRTIVMPTEAEARAYLTQLAVDLLSSGNDYFLPIEAVEEVLPYRDGGGSEIAAAIRSVSGKQRTPCRSDYGPVRHARTFRAPIAEIKSGLIERRFGPLMTILKPAAETE